MGRIVGIDLGTTTSEIAYIKNGKPVIIKNGYSSITPSVVGLNKNMEIVVGDEAKNQLYVRKSETVSQVKRKMGTGEMAPMGYQKYTPVEISAEILKYLKKLGEEYLREEITSAVITVPANFNNAQRQATKEAGEKAGFVVDRIINEPTAAALAFGINNMEVEGKILVYDLGGGTFDVTIGEMIEGSLSIILSRGIDKLGGIDFDELIFQEMLKVLKFEYGMDLSKDDQALQRLYLEAEKAKISLSRVNSITISIPYLMPNCSCFEMNLTREHYEDLISDYVKQTMDTVKTALDDAGITADEVDIVLAVGGSSRTPLVMNSLKELFGNKIRGGIERDEAVALGAAVQAGIISDEISGDGNIVIFDVCNHSLGVNVVRETTMGLEGGFFSIHISRDTHLPASKAIEYTTIKDYQTSMRFKIYQGEDDLVKNNTKLGELIVTGIPSNKAEEEIVEVTFTYDLNGILIVTAKVLSTGKQLSTKIEMEYEKTNTDFDINNKKGSIGDDIKTTVLLYQKYRNNLPDGVKRNVDELMRQLKQAVADNDKDKILELDDKITALIFEFITISG